VLLCLDGVLVFAVLRGSPALPVAWIGVSPFLGILLLPASESRRVHVVAGARLAVACDMADAPGIADGDIHGN